MKLIWRSSKPIRPIWVKGSFERINRSHVDWLLHFKLRHKIQGRAKCGMRLYGSYAVINRRLSPYRRGE